MKSREFIKNEKDYYGKIFVDITYGIDNITPFISEKELARRKYVSRLPVLDKYIKSLETAEREEERAGFLDRFKNDSSFELLQGYKRDHNKELRQLEKCNGCKCLNCTAECKFEGCGGCREDGHIVSCDHERVNAAFYDDYIINLINERTGREDEYKVMAIIEDVQRSKKYIVIEGLQSDEKYILYFYEGISEDTYGEITDENEFSSVVEAYESIERN